MNILYITYDGLTDFIGQSQVLPYLLGCAAAGHQLTVISFEKADRKALIGADVDRQCREAGIEWLPQRFRSRPPYLAKLIDQLAMHRAARAASARQRFDVLHCRSYPASMVGLSLKRRSKARLIFDMRGFWADQRREGGRWKDGDAIGRRLYAHWKGNEARLVGEADHMIVLTTAARTEIQRWPAYRGAPISVIPCCADFSHYRVASRADQLQAKGQLGITDDAPVLAYLGSFGTVYMIVDHLRLFEAIRRREGDTKALFIGRDSAAEILAIASRNGINLRPGDIRVVHSEREQVPFWLGAADAGTCFIIPSFSSKGVSPTKLAEYFACGVPVIANSPVGDVDDIVCSLAAGHVVTGFSNGQIEQAADAFLGMRDTDRTALRERARLCLDLPTAVSAYLRVYDDLGSAVTATSW